MLTIKEGDTPTVRWLAVDHRTGGPLDITGSVATLHLRQGKATPILIPVTVVGPGEVEHTFDGSLAAGPYAYEIQFVRDGVILTAPTEGTYQLRVDAQIA